MTRLFLRFYLSVISILVVAWLIQGFVIYRGNIARNSDVVQAALFGGLRSARDQLAEADPNEIESKLTEIKSNFDYPVELKPMNEFADNAGHLRKFGKGDPVFVNSSTMAISFDDNQQVLIFGPLPQWIGPSQSAFILGLGAVLLLSAAAIALLLRPIVRQLRSVERTAMAIAEGDLSARIKVRDYSTSVPIASAFNAMADRIESLLKSKRELLQVVSHELRTPLARIQFATELLETDVSDQERKTRLAAIDNATQELDSLVGELLSYVRLESESRQSNFETVDVGELLTRVIDIRSPLHKGIKFSVENSDNVLIEADRIGLTRAIGNLVSNAGKHAKSQVVLKASHVDDGQVSITVEDDGDGINDADYKSVFEPFVRLENSSEQGAGLGLTLVSRIADRHFGSVSAKKSELGGASFEMLLPRTKS